MKLIQRVESMNKMSLFNQGIDTVKRIIYVCVTVNRNRVSVAGRMLR